MRDLSEEKPGFTGNVDERGEMLLTTGEEKRVLRMGDYDQIRTCLLKGDLEKAKLLIKFGLPYDRHDVIMGGHLELLIWLKNNGDPPNEGRDTLTAANLGQLKIVKWLNINGSPYTAVTFANAAARGHFEMVKALWEDGCPRDNSAIERAARHGQFEIVKWLSEKDEFHLNETVMHRAATADYSLEMMEWLWDRRCPIDERALTFAAAVGPRVNVRWLWEKRAPYMPDIMERVFHEKRYDVIHWLHEQGVPCAQWILDQILN